MKQYEIWWANLPAPAGRRRVVLLSRGSAYQYLHKFVVAEITTTIRGIAEEVPLGRAEGLPRPFVANCDNLRTVARSSLVKKAGALPVNRHVEIKKALGHALAWTELIGL